MPPCGADSTHTHTHCSCSQGCPGSGGLVVTISPPLHDVETNGGKCGGERMPYLPHYVRSHQFSPSQHPTFHGMELRQREREIERVRLGRETCHLMRPRKVRCVHLLAAAAGLTSPQKIEGSSALKIIFYETTRPLRSCGSHGFSHSIMPKKPYPVRGYKH